MTYPISDQTLPSLVEHTDILVHPLMPGSGKTRQILPVSDDLVDEFAHLRFRAGKHYSTVEPHIIDLDVVAGSQLSGTTLYGGIFFNHFGHFLAESIHRLWPLTSGCAGKIDRILFHAILRRGRPRPIEAWAHDVLGYLGIDASCIRFVDEPVQVERLLIGGQASLYGVGPIVPDYSKLLRGKVSMLADPTIAKQVPKRLFVTRARHTHSGYLLGEEYLGKWLRDQTGFSIIYPEQLLPSELINLFESAQCILFSEGSAIHVVELCGPLRASIYVACRRRSQDVDRDMFGSMLRQKTSLVRFSATWPAITPLDWEPTRDAPAWQNASALPDLVALIADIADFFAIPIPLPDPAEVSITQRLSLLKMILNPLATRSNVTPHQLGDLLKRLRDQSRELGLAVDI